MAGVNKENKTCLSCGAEFNRPYKCSAKEWSRKKYCSTKCYHASRIGEKSRNWKGGRKTDSRGYIEIYKPGHYHADKNGYVKEHIYKIVKILGRNLMVDEVVHHKNEIKTDNRIKNLEVLTRSEHMTRHQKGKVFSLSHRRKISERKKETAHLIQRNTVGQFKGGASYGR